MASYTLTQVAANTNLPIEVMARDAEIGLLLLRAGKVSDAAVSKYNPDLTAQQAANYLGMDGSSIRLNCRKGAIVAKQFGQQWMIRRFALDAFDARAKAKTGRPRKRDAEAKTAV